MIQNVSPRQKEYFELYYREPPPLSASASYVGHAGDTYAFQSGEGLRSWGYEAIPSVHVHMHMHMCRDCGDGLQTMASTPRTMRASRSRTTRTLSHLRT